MVQVMVWLSGLATLAGFLLFLPVCLVFCLIKQKESSAATAFVFFIAAIIIYGLLVSDVENIKISGLIQFQELQYLAPGMLLVMMLFFPIWLLLCANKQKKVSTAMAYVFCIAVVMFYSLLLNNVEKTVKKGDLLKLKAIRYLAPTMWLLMRDELWHAVAESEQAFPSVWKFMIEHGSSPDGAFKEIFLYRTGTFTDEEEATLVEMLMTVPGWRRPPAQLTQMLERAFEIRHFRTIIAFARHEITCYSLKFQPGEKSLLHLAADAGADADSLSRLAACMGYDPWRVFDSSGYTPVHYLRYPEQLKALPSASEAVLLFTRDGATLLHLAVQNGFHELFDQIVQSGFASDTPDLDGCPPAFYATDFATFQKLRPKGLNPHLKDSATFKRLWGNALKSGSEEFIATLLQQRADPDAILFNGNRPLHQILLTYGVDMQFIPRMINILASAGADINQPNWNGDTPLHYAIMQNNLAAAQLLINLGANTRFRNMQGKTVLSLMWEAPNKALWSNLYHQLLMQGILAEVEHPVDQNLPDWNRSFPADYSP
ncbi:MAG: hypothetical protein CVV41_21170 [Candidatus Riflebacteria bacterium HGW-Riflebacteria-1]|jgi:ankyrin repeat protein|nr:MAG: hypothetical protein CVV41_21170 [Candidatus Riflebacteria bacterium HGW-Riflebacteria-1]